MRNSLLRVAASVGCPYPPHRLALPGGTVGGNDSFGRINQILSADFTAIDQGLDCSLKSLLGGFEWGVIGLCHDL